MTNYEKYKDIVLSCIAQDSVCDLAYVAYVGKSCHRRTCTECCKFVVEWLNREYNEIDWSKVPVDTPVMIKDEKGLMFRHFSGYLHGYVFVYANGQTSWTNDGKTEAWEPEFVKLGRDEDNKKYAK